MGRAVIGREDGWHADRTAMARQKEEKTVMALTCALYEQGMWAESFRPGKSLFLPEERKSGQGHRNVSPGLQIEGTA